MPSSRNRIVVAGEALVDDLPGPDGGRVLRPGGAPLNVAIALARLGAPAAFAGPIGDDDAGDLLRRHLADNGVQQRIPAVARPTGRAVTTVDEAGHPEYAFELHRTACDLVEVGLRHVSWSDAVAVVGGAVGLDEHPLGASLSLLAGSVRVPLWFDPNIRPRVLGDTEPARRRYRSLVEAVVADADVVKVSDEDLRLLYGSDADLDRIARDWSASGPHLVVLTLGGDGLAAFRAGQRALDVPAAPIEPSALADTVGAGDTVTGALLAWAARHGALDGDGPLRRREGLREALEFAARAAAVTVTRRGADPPTLAELG